MAITGLRGAARPRPHPLPGRQQVGDHPGDALPPRPLLGGGDAPPGSPTRARASSPSPTPGPRWPASPPSAASGASSRTPGDIGGRYSALSLFGLVPAAVMGLDVGLLLDRALAMRASCGASTAPGRNRGPRAGQRPEPRPRRGPRQGHHPDPAPARRLLPLGGAAHRRVDRQGGQGVHPDRRGADRQARRLRRRPPLRGALPGQRALPCGFAGRHPDRRRPAGGGPRAGRPLRPGRRVLPLGVRHRGGGGVAPDRPLRRAQRQGVEGQHPERAGGLRAERQPPRGGARREQRRGARLRRRPGGLRRARRCSPTSPRCVPATTSRSWPTSTPATPTRRRWRSCAPRSGTAYRVATTVGFGPRFLHSTGQLHKGGPNTGVFIQVTTDEAVDAPIPGQALHLRDAGAGPGGGRPAVAAQPRAPGDPAAHRRASSGARWRAWPSRCARPRSGRPPEPRRPDAGATRR